MIPDALVLAQVLPERGRAVEKQVQSFAPQEVVGVLDGDRVDVGLVSRARSDAVLSQIRERLVLTGHSTAEARLDAGGVVLGEHLAGP